MQVRDISAKEEWESAYSLSIPVLAVLENGEERQVGGDLHPITARAEKKTFLTLMCQPEKQTLQIIIIPYIDSH